MASAVRIEQLNAVVERIRINRTQRRVTMWMMMMMMMTSGVSNDFAVTSKLVDFDLLQ